MSKLVAITGANGHLGNVLCRLLCEKGYHVRALCRSQSESLEGLPIEVVLGDVLNKGDVQRLLEGCEIVIHCAAVISIHGDPTGIVFQTNTEGPRNVREIAEQLAVRRIVHISSVHAVTELPFSQPFDETRPYKQATDYAYDYSKAQGEQIMLRNTGKGKPEVVVLRPSCIIGPFDFKPSEIGKALLELEKSKIPALPEGGYDFVDIQDVANSVLNAMERGRSGEVYLLTGKYYSMKEFAAVVAKVLGRRPIKWIIPYRLLKTLLPLIAWLGKVSNSPPLFTLESLDALKNGHPAWTAPRLPENWAMLADPWKHPSGILPLAKTKATEI
ncbi:MAG: NAD-dependent epimerase/dehydratase family protein [Saprospiraceae bacterium]|nr:NAD-dependent epimerase/dehydratase family protein [Saprospiraceae bacterium]